MARLASPVTKIGESALARGAMPILTTLVVIAATTALLWIFNLDIEPHHLIYIYFIPTTFVAIRFGSPLAMVVTFAIGVAAAFFVYKPRYSLFVSDPLDVMELICFGTLAMLASQVVSGFARDDRVRLRDLSDRPVRALFSWVKARGARR